MTNPEQMSFDFEGKDIPPAEKKAENEVPSRGPSRIEVDDECQYCGAPFESNRSCQYCASNPTKKDFLKSNGK